MNNCKLTEQEIIKEIKVQFGNFLHSVTTDFDGIVIRLVSKSGEVFPPFVAIQETEINTHEKLKRKIAHIKSRASITEDFGAPFSWQ